MKELEIFYLTGCPYCAMGRRAVEALCAEDPRFASLPLRWIEERQNPEIADARDYYYVPAGFLGGEKLFEASPSDDYEAVLSKLRGAFLRAVSE